MGTMDRKREALKKIIELRSKERRRRSRRSIEDAVRLGELARLRFRMLFEVVEWGREKRVLKMRS
jgi:hypothetical protein